MSARGFSLIELLVACAMLATIGGALALMAAPLGDMVDRSLAVADLEGARRGGIEALVADLREAGSAPGNAPAVPGLWQFAEPVRLLRSLETNEPANPASAVRVLRVPHPAAQAVLRTPAEPGDTVLRLDTVTRCSTGSPVCGFRPGLAAVVYDSAGLAEVAVVAVGDAQIQISAALRDRLTTGAVVAQTVTTTYGTRLAADGSRRLVRLTAGGAEQPVVDNVVGFAVTADSDDPRRVRQVGVVLRLEAAGPWLRGPAGPLFVRGGTATDARRWVPDVEIRASVALRNPPGEPP